jgi:uncharacterized protein
MIVVSNTSPLTNLAAIGKFDLLHQLFEKIIIPEAVWEELNYGGNTWPGSREVDFADWIEKRHVEDRNLVLALKGDLDNGEAESIGLALELQADLLLLDEHEGRRAAARLGLSVIGVVGVLLVAKESGKLDQIRPCLDTLRQHAGFYLSEPLYRDVLIKAGEAG